MPATMFSGVGTRVEAESGRSYSHGFLLPHMVNDRFKFYAKLILNIIYIELY